MPIAQLEVDKFITNSNGYTIFDVRSPSEYNRGHIPGSISLPLFSDEQRRIIGTAYKQQSRKVAVNEGLRFFSETMQNIPGQVIGYLEQTKKGTIYEKIFLHCWRGGMRSNSVAWLLDLYGYKVYTLAGGYKSFRQWVLASFELPYSLKILGGYTGSGKTEVIKKLQASGQTTIDLEGLASHRGSAFGSLGMESQPTQEMFENELACKLKEVFQVPNGIGIAGTGTTEIWLEDESRHIGKLGIPNTFWELMRRSKLYFLEIPFEERLSHIVSVYGDFRKNDLIEAVCRIEKRLGGLATKQAVAFLEEGNIEECFSILLSYYDRLYKNALQNRENLELLLTKIPLTNVNDERAASRVSEDLEFLRITK